jgi:hypothetical protein
MVSLGSILAEKYSKMMELGEAFSIGSGVYLILSTARRGKLPLREDDSFVRILSASLTRNFYHTNHSLLQ